MLSGYHARLHFGGALLEVREGTLDEKQES
jgi:hypothetical protein